MKSPLGSQLLLGNPINQGLVGCWLLTEGGGLVNDLSGNYQPLSVPSGWSWVPEYRGPSLAGDASGYMTTTGGSRITGYPFTLSAAFRCTAQNNAESCLISIGQVGFWGNFHELSAVFFTGTPDIAVYNWSYESGSGNQKIECSQTGGGLLRHLVVLVCVSATERQVWLNGVLVGTGTTSVAFNSAIDSIRIGGRASSENADRMISSVHLESVMAWNRALSAVEVIQLRDQPFAGFARSSLPLWLGAMGGEAVGTAYTETINDGVGVTDALVRACQFNRTLTESIGTTDALGNASAAIRAMADTLGLTDMLAKGETKALSDALGIVDSLIRVWEASRSFAETVGQTDGLTKDETKVLTNIIGLTDVAVNVSVVLRTIADSLGLTDDISPVWEAVRTIADSLGLTDDISPVWEAVRTIADALGITDVMSEVFEPGGVFLRTINDAVGLSDSLAAIQVLLRVMAENLGMADAVASVLTASRIISDSEGITDGITLGRMVSVSDTLGITDDLSRLVQYLRTQNDTEGLLDSMARVVVALRTVNDTVGMTDQMERQFGALLKAVWAFMLLKHKR